MKKKEIILILFLAVFFSVGLAAQSKETIIENKIQKITVHEYFLDRHTNKPVVELIETYNDSGNLVEIKEFNSDSEIKRWEKYTYNENGNLTEEIFLNWKGKVDRIEKSIYKDGLRVEKRFFDSKGKLYKKKVYIYEYHK